MPRLRPSASTLEGFSTLKSLLRFRFRYWIAISSGTSPGILISGKRILALNLDGLFILSTQNNSLLLNNVGILPTNGKISAVFPIPPIKALVNFRVYFAGLVLNSKYTGLVKSFSKTLTLTIRN